MGGADIDDNAATSLFFPVKWHRLIAATGGNMRWFLASVCALVALTACATPAPLPSEMQLRLNQIAAATQPTSSASGVFTVVDQRDRAALQARRAPTGIAGGFSCSAGVEQLGDSRHANDRIARLAAALSAAYPTAPAGSELVIRRYDIYLNHTAEWDAANRDFALSLGNYSALAGERAARAARPQEARVARCSRDRMTHGWFEPSDLTNTFPPITIDIDVTVFGRQHVINVAYSPDVDFYQLGYTFGDESRYPEAQAAMEATLQRAMTRAESRLIESGSAGMSHAMEGAPVAPE